MRHALARLAGLLLLSAAPAAFGQSPAADAPIATAQGAPTASGASVNAQIQQYLDASPAACQGVASLEPLPDRKPHGEVSVAVGTGGYRSAYARGDFPAGKNGTVSVAVGQSEGRGWRGQRYRDQSLALGYSYARPDEGLQLSSEDAMAQRANACEAASRWISGPRGRDPLGG